MTEEPRRGEAYLGLAMSSSETACGAARMRRVDLVLDNRAAFRWVGTDTYDIPRRGSGISYGTGMRMAGALNSGGL